MSGARTSVIGGATILALVLAIFGVSILITILFRLPSSLSLPIELRIVGGAAFTAGVTVANWLFRYRSSGDMIRSTYVTFSKMFRREPITQKAGRTEPLVLDGPQKYVRHPLYFGVIMIVLGVGLLISSTYFLIAGVIFVIWFSFVQIPFEEKELRALFGEQYAKYVEDTPMLVPFTKRKRKTLK
jgi:protein-S-isoprenylcysteine O-methyltransferase Ste14